MIQKIKISNFQKHKELEINLNKYNLIVGPSSSGKSAIFRALRFLFYGEWDRTYPNNIDEPTEVKITFDNGIEIGRKKIAHGEKRLSSYYNTAYIKEGNEIFKFENFGDTIPQIFNIINLKPISLGSKQIELNFSNQDDKLFILTESRFIKAKWLGRLYGAHLINNAISLMTKDKRNLIKEQEIKNEEIIEIKTNLKKYENLNDKKELLDYINNLFERYKKINELKDRILKFKEEKKNIEKIAQKYDKIDTYELKQLLLKYKFIKKMKDIDNKIKEYEELDNKIKTIDVKNIKDNIKKYKKLIEIKQKINNIDAKISDYLTISNSLDNEYSKLKDEINSKITVCPLCGQKLEDKLRELTIQKILKK
jgi:DNA repair exonuclease SbcCD ATPase subunit